MTINKDYSDNIISSTIKREKDSNYKKLKLQKFNNLKVQGILLKDKEWDLCFETSFYCNVSNLAPLHFKNQSDFQRWLTKNCLGLSKIKNEIRNQFDQIKDYWTYDPDIFVTYTHEHSLNSFSFNKKNFLGFDIKLTPLPHTYSNSDWRAIYPNYEKTCEWISNLNIFQENEYIQFSSSAKKN